MVIIDYKKSQHKEIISSCVTALKSGKVVACPTDTSYGLAVDATNINAVKKLYLIKGRGFNKPVHVIVPSVAYAKKNVLWNSAASKLAKKFWPGALSLVLPLRIKNQKSKILSAGSGFLGIRFPKNNVALGLSLGLKGPITATSANRSGEKDCYSAAEIVAQFKRQKIKPDIIINAGRLPKRKPSTMVKIENGKITILREGPILAKEILKIQNV